MQFPCMSWQYLLHPTPGEVTLASLGGEKFPPRAAQFQFDRALPSVLRVYFPSSCVMKIGKLPWREPMTLHLVSSIRLLSSASSFDSSQDSVAYFHGANRDLRQRGPNGKGRSCHEKAVLNNLSGIKVTLWSKWSHHWQQFFPTSVLEACVITSKGLVGESGVDRWCLTKCKGQKCGEREWEIVVAISVCCDDNGVRRRKKYLRFDSAY